MAASIASSGTLTLTILRLPEDFPDSPRPGKADYKIHSRYAQGRAGRGRKAPQGQGVEGDGPRHGKARYGVA